jgi:hypothetical protein
LEEKTMNKGMRKMGEGTCKWKGKYEGKINAKRENNETKCA